MPMGDADAQALPTPAAAIAASHIGRSPGLIDEHQPVRIEIGLAIEPVLATLQDVGASLLGGVGRLFLRVIL